MGYEIARYSFGGAAEWLRRQRDDRPSHATLTIVRGRDDAK